MAEIGIQWSYHLGTCILVMMNSEVLNSWKEIAAYLGRGVRTVQRWEQELALPVRRPRGKDRSAVIALKADLDRWLYHTPNHGNNRTAEFKRHHAVLVQRIAVLQERTQVFAIKFQVLREQISYAMHLTQQLPHPGKKPLHVSRTEFISDSLPQKSNGKLHPALIDSPLSGE